MDVVLLVLSFVKKNKMFRENLDCFPVILVLILNYTCHHANMFLFTRSKNSLLNYIIFKGSFLSFLQQKLLLMDVDIHYIDWQLFFVMYMLLIVICEDNLAQLMNVKITGKIILKIIIIFFKLQLFLWLFPKEWDFRFIKDTPVRWAWFIFKPTCCSRLRTPLPWEHAETWCHRTPAWCHQWPRLDSPSPGLRRTSQRWRASPTEKWLRQTPAPQECRPPTREKVIWGPMFGHFRRGNMIHRVFTLNSPRPHPRLGSPGHFQRRTVWKIQFHFQCESEIWSHRTCCEWLWMQKLF